jgi:tripartite-type tricarboxylate transporter receptor subunit TctC
VNLPEIRERLLAQGLEPAGTTSAEFAEYLKSEMEMAATVVKASGASVQ